MTTASSDKLTKAVKLLESLNATVNFMYNKKNRARTTKSFEKWCERYWFYRDFQTRAWDLAFRLRYPLKAGPWTSFERRSAIEIYLKSEDARIARGKIDFEVKHKYSMHFFQSSLRADYGTFQCDRCGSHFYHSPSTITKAAKVVFSCACGYCTNEIIKADWNQEPYF